MNQSSAAVLYLGVPALAAAGPGAAELGLAFYLANFILIAAPQLLWIAFASILGTAGTRWHIVMLVPTAAAVGTLAAHLWLSPSEGIFLWPLYGAISLVGMVLAYFVYPVLAPKPRTGT